jgi:hypothetical protein
VGEGGTQRLADSHARVERRARRRKLGQQQRAHFLFILLHSEWPSLVAASSEPDSLPFFGRAAGIERTAGKRVKGSGQTQAKRFWRVRTFDWNLGRRF